MAEFNADPIAAVTLPACPGLPQGTAALVVTPSTNPTIGVGATLDFSVANQLGVTVPDCAVTWSVSDTKIASISNVGVAVGRKIGGPITVRAQSGGAKPVRGTAFLTVGSPVASVTLTPASGSMVVGSTLQFQVTARDAAGVLLSDRQILWASSTVSVGTVSSFGLVSALSAGTTEISATIEGKRATASVAVKAPDEWIYFNSSLDGLPTGEEIYAVRPDGTGLTRITTRFGADITPVLSPNRQRLALASEAWCISSCWIQPELYTMNPDGSNLTRLSFGMHPIYGLTWSPDGTTIVVESQGGTVLAENRRLYAIPAAGGSPTQLTFEESQQPEWSPDGRYILYCSPSGVVRIDANGANRQVLRSLTNNAPPNPSCSRADWSPDGTQIAFALNNEQVGTPSGLWLMNADGSNARPITTTMDYVPRWSPDGKALTFISREGTNGYFQVFKINIDGTNRRQLTSLLGHAFGPSWH